MPRFLQRLARYFKAAPAASDSAWALPVEAVRRRPPTARELIGELKNTAWTCASINAAVCASYSPRLYVATFPRQAAPKCATRPVERTVEQRLRRWPRCQKAARLDEVLDHPLLTLLAQVNAEQNAWDLWELTTLYQEAVGSAYWHLALGPLGTPEAIWILPAQHVTPVRLRDSRRPVDYYEYGAGPARQRFPPEEILHFKYPDPRDPYGAGLPPLRACWEHVALTSSYLAFKQATWDNTALPSAVISPADVIGDEERDRLEEQWQRKFRHGGAGKVLIAESGMKVDILSHSAGDLALLAEYGKTKEDIANAFHVPLSYLVSETNLANLQAAERQHLTLAIRPRLQRRDEKLNERLVPLFDPTGRLFLASDDPVPPDREQALKQLELDLKWGVRTVNEVRAERGLPPVPWGETPCLAAPERRPETASA